MTFLKIIYLEDCYFTNGKIIFDKFTLQKVASGKAKPTNYFDIDHYEGDFCTEEDLNVNVRLRVLQLRAQEVPEFRDLKFIPANESEILRKKLEVSIIIVCYIQMNLKF